MFFSRALAPLALLLAAHLLTACESQPESGAPTEDSNLTQSNIAKLSDAKLEALRSSYEGALGSQGGDFYGYAVAVRWGTEKKIGATLSKEQLSFLASELVHAQRTVTDRIPYALDLLAEDLPAERAASSELRVNGAAASELDDAIGKAQKAGFAVSRIDVQQRPKAGKPTAGALMIVDVPHREALIVYGRRGSAPLAADCTVTEMHSYEFEEALSKDEYPDVDAREVPLSGDVVLDIGGNAPLSNGIAEAEGESYHVTVKKTDAAIEIAAEGEPSRGKLVLQGDVGTVYGDRDGNGRPNKAATVRCTTIAPRGARAEP